MTDSFPPAVLVGGLVAAFAALVAPEWLDLELPGLALVLGAALLGALAVYLVVLKAVAGRREPVRGVSWRSVALVVVGAGLLVGVAATHGGDAGRVAALTAPALGLLCAGVAAWVLRRRGAAA